MFFYQSTRWIKNQIDHEVVQELGEEAWESDGIHMKAAGYDKIAELVAHTVDEMAERCEATVRSKAG